MAAATIRSRRWDRWTNESTSSAPTSLFTRPRPLAEDTEVSGIVEAQLTFATDVTDTDFFVTLSDVYPDGKAIDITEGQARTRFRESQERPTLLTPNKETSISGQALGHKQPVQEGPSHPRAHHQQ
jgi:predicted acyl esterase